MHVCVQQEVMGWVLATENSPLADAWRKQVMNDERLFKRQNTVATRVTLLSCILVSHPPMAGIRFGSQHERNGTSTLSSQTVLYSYDMKDVLVTDTLHHHNIKQTKTVGVRNDN